VTIFKVQTYLAAVSGYDNVAAYSPDYVWSVAKVFRRWWCPWPRIEVGIVKNFRSAELSAAAKALTHARILRRRVKTRILRVTQLDGKETKMVVWDNGKVLDPTILPWYWRVFRWALVTEAVTRENTK
jgi:hypothetical protein